MKAGKPLSYLPDNRFSLVETKFYKRVPNGRVIPGDEVNELEPIVAVLIHYVGLALAVESRFRKIERINFCAYDSPQFDAFAFVHSQSGVVVISLGAIRYCACLAYSLLATSEMVNAYGLFAKAEIDYQNYRSLIRNDNGFPELSFNNQRFQASYQLSALALSGVAFHEVGHIINGHSMFMAKYKEINTRVLQALEYDADCYTIPALVNLTKTINARGRVKLVTNYGQIVELASFAAAMPFAMAGSTGLLVSDGFDPEKDSHPPHARRCWSAFGVGQEMLVRAKCRPDLAASNMAELQMRLIRATALVTGSELKISRAKLLCEIESKLAYLGEFKEVWAALRPRLAPLKIGIGNLAPAETRDKAKESLNIIASDHEIDLLKPK